MLKCCSKGALQGAPMITGVGKDYRLGESHNVSGRGSIWEVHLGGALSAVQWQRSPMAARS
jgi:hypothetical protein